MKIVASLAAMAAAVIPFALTPQSNAAAEYCHTDTDGDYVCIEKVFGTRRNRGMVFTVNGNVYAGRFNCYDYDYGATSITAIACWDYTGIESDPKDMPKITEIPESIKGIMTGGGFVSEDKAIDLEKVRNAMPAEMQ